MYDYIAGELVEKKPSHVIVDCGGIGYFIEVSLTTCEALPKQGRIKIYTHLKVSDDDMRLIGFATREEREVFRAFISSVGGLGASKALAILSHVSLDELARCIEEGDAVTLRRIRGIGEKLAQRLIVEMKGRMTSVYDKGRLPGEGAVAQTREALQALVSLGYQPQEARAAVEKAVKEGGRATEIEDLIRRALQNL